MAVRVERTAQAHQTARLVPLPFEPCEQFGQQHQLALRPIGRGQYFAGGNEKRERQHDAGQHTQDRERMPCEEKDDRDEIEQGDGNREDLANWLEAGFVVGGE